MTSQTRAREQRSIKLFAAGHSPFSLLDAGFEPPERFSLGNFNATWRPHPPMDHRRSSRNCLSYDDLTHMSIRALEQELNNGRGRKTQFTDIALDLESTDFSVSIALNNAVTVSPKRKSQRSDLIYPLIRERLPFCSCIRLRKAKVSHLFEPVGALRQLI
ncbi:hypothetical protein [Curtobacterium sp. KT1]|uniref:hypothetical protein n=1 Tax=Curtobacterium sp. KT1 TaxID=3372858 RepID=UPI0037BF15E5